MERGDETRDANNHEDVEETAADDVADSYGAVAFACGDDRSGEFGEGCAASDDSEADDSVANAEEFGDLCGAVDKDIATAD